MIKQCTICGKEFETKYSLKVTCSDSCHKTKSKRRDKKWRDANIKNVHLKAKEWRIKNYAKFQETQKKYRQSDKFKKILESNRVIHIAKNCVICGKEFSKSINVLTCSKRCGDKLYRKNNIEKIREIEKIYYKKKKKEKASYQKKYREENKEKIALYFKNRQKQQKENIKIYRKRHYNTFIKEKAICEDCGSKINLGSRWCCKCRHKHNAGIIKKGERRRTFPYKTKEEKRKMKKKTGQLYREKHPELKGLKSLEYHFNLRKSKSPETYESAREFYVNYYKTKEVIDGQANHK